MSAHHPIIYHNAPSMWAHPSVYIYFMLRACGPIIPVYMTMLLACGPIRPYIYMTMLLACGPIHPYIYISCWDDGAPSSLYIFHAWRAWADPLSVDVCRLALPAQSPRVVDV